MPIDDFQFFKDGQARVSELKRLGDEVEANSRLAGVGGAVVRRNSAGIEVSLPQAVFFWAKITGNDGGSPAAHSWTEQGEPSGGPPLADATDARTGTTTAWPAYALNGAVMSTNSIVRLYLSLGGDYYLFDPGPAAGATTFSGARATGGGTVLTSGAFTDLGLTAPATFDTDSYFSAGPPSVMTVPSTGYYQFGGFCEFPAVANIECATAFGGGNTDQVRDFTGSTSDVLWQSLTSIAHLTAGTTIKLTAYQNSGVNQTTGSQTLWIYKLGT
jgi:hypothetical protein